MRRHLVRRAKPQRHSSWHLPCGAVRVPGGAGDHRAVRAGARAGLTCVDVESLAIPGGPGLRSPIQRNAEGIRLY